MVETWVRITASLVCSLIVCFATRNLLGVVQQSGYQSKGFLRWLKRKDNMAFNRLSVLSLCLLLTTTVTALCFSFLGTRYALLISAVPYVALWLLYIVADKKYALKVPVKYTGRVKRLFAFYLLFTACSFFAVISFLNFLSVWNGSTLYALLSYAPTFILTLLLPFILALANAFTSVFETARNKKFVKRAGQVLAERNYIRVGIVGSYGKTSVKNILETILSQKYKVLATPASYNTPVGIAKTVFSENAENAEVFIAEMGARKTGDIAELYEMVKPDYAIFTGVCAQHMATFGSMENAYAEKSKILACKKVVCGESLRAQVGENDHAIFADCVQIKDIRFLPTQTQFTLCLKDGEIGVTTKILGKSAVENIRLCALLAKEMGLTLDEIQKGIESVKPIPHRLQLMESGGVYILDDGYNANIVGAQEAILALSRFENKKCVVTQGLVECGVLEEELNNRLGEMLAKANLDKVILVGETLVTAVKNGYISAGGDTEKLTVVKSLEQAKAEYAGYLTTGDAILFLNDLPDFY